LVTPSPILNLTNLLDNKLKLIFIKNLELTQMEMLHVGSCSNTTNLVNGVGIVSVALGALLITTTGLALFPIGAFARLYSIRNCID
jgi:hypothetical protein